MNSQGPIKRIYQLAKNAILLKNGPTKCDSAQNITISSSGSHEQLFGTSHTSFAIPKTNIPALHDFFAAKSIRSIPAVTVSRIPWGSVYAGGVVLSPDGTTIARDLSMDFGKPVSEHYLCHQRIQRPARLNGSALCVASAATSSYYHWLLDELPRQLALKNETFDNIICSRDTRQNREILKLLGRSGARVVYTESTQKPSWNHYKAESLVVPSYVSAEGQPSDLLVKLIKEFAEPLLKKGKLLPEKIFITRSKAPSRYIINESEVFAELEPAGFKLIELEKLTWGEQINLFNNAKQIISPHGAGLANLVFCAQSPQVIEIFHPKYVH
jgi:capsular polysaccharide biosynthesis protein